MAAIGQRKMASPDMKLRRDCAECTIFQGTCRIVSRILRVNGRIVAYHDPTRRDGGQNDASTNADPLWKQIDKVVACTDHVCRQVRTDLGDDPAKAYKEGTASTSWAVPLSCQSQRVPKILTIHHLRRRGANYTEHAYDDGNKRKEETLPIHAARPLQVPGKVRHVGCHCSPACTMLVESLQQYSFEAAFLTACDAGH